jgi:hypothetical protein
LAFHIHIEEQWHRAFVFAGGTALALGCAVLLSSSAARSDNPASDDAVGTIEGDAIALQGPMSVEVVGGQIKTMLRSGNDIRVKSGQARLELVEGGQIAICGPAHLSVLKSGGSLTLALDTGIIHAHIERKPTLTVYTAQIQAKPIAIGDAPQDALIGFEAPGAMCVRATAGAIRLEQQLTAQNVIVPQGGDVMVNNGQLEGLQTTPGHCACELQTAKVEQRQPELSRVATPDEFEHKEKEKEPEAKKAPTEPAKRPAAAKEEPIYQVFMPPLAYDAHAAVQKDTFDPKLILLVRRVRVRPTLVFQGRVEEKPAIAQNPDKAGKPAQGPSASTSARTAPTAPPDDSLFGRVRAFFRRLFS